MQRQYLTLTLNSVVLAGLLSCGGAGSIKGTPDDAGGNGGSTIDAKVDTGEPKQRDARANRNTTGGSTASDANTGIDADVTDVNAARDAGDASDSPRSFSDAGTTTSAPFMVNIWGDCYWCGTPLFVDLMKAAERWRVDWTEWGNYDESLITVDANDWPTSLNWTGSEVARSCVGHPYRLGRYIVKWKGQGRFDITSHGGSMSPFSVTATGAGESDFTVTDAALTCVEISQTNADDPLRDIVVVHEDFATTYESEPFYPEMLEFLSDFAGVRFMDWIETNNNTIKNWSDRESGTNRVVANSYEYAIRLSNQLFRNGWFTIPHLATDDFIRNLAILLRDQMDPRLKIYIEYSNETWNFMFGQASYCRDQGVAQNVGTGDEYEKGFRFHAKRSLEIFNIFETVFGDQMDRVVRVVAGQTGNTWMAGVHIDYSDMIDHIDAYATAPYFGIDSVSNFDGAALNWDLDDLFGELTNNALPEATRRMNDMAAYLATRGVDFIAYEGGQHLTNWETGPTTDLYIAANRDARMGTLYDTYWTTWKNSGGKLFAIYDALREPGQHGSWGLKETLDQPRSDAPKYDATLSWMALNPKWW